MLIYIVKTHIVLLYQTLYAYIDIIYTHTQFYLLGEVRRYTN